MSGINRKIRFFLGLLAGKEKIFRPDIRIPTERFGTRYGGWDLATTGLGGDSIVYSFGIGEDLSFDIALCERFGLEVHAFDPTPRSVAWVEGQDLPDSMIHHGYGLASRDGTALFHPPADPAHVSHSMVAEPGAGGEPREFPVRRLSTIMAELGHERIDILKMDVEGAEYEVIGDLENSAVRPWQILVEFHHRMRGVGLGDTERAVQRLRSMGYRLYSVSAVNEEFCFILL